MSGPVDLARSIHEQLLEALDLRRNDVIRMEDTQLREMAARLIRQIVAGSQVPPGAERAALEKLVLQEALGLGPLEDLLADDTISEIMVNGPGDVFIERGGQLREAGVAFSGGRALRGIIERVIAPTGRRVDESSPMVDARLQDGSRVNAIIPPLAVRGAAVTIRKFPGGWLGLDALLERETLSAQMLAFLAIAVHTRRNIIVSGGTGSGKTTLLNGLSSLIPASERVVTIEDAAELQLKHRNLVNLEARPANLEGKGEITIRDLVRNALRMRPDRIVVGECRGGEALDMLQAMNTGHDGSLATAHANSPRDLLSRLEVMVLMAGIDLPVSAIREQIASAIHLIVQQARYPCGSRKIARITEITGTESGRIQTQDLFRFVRRGIDAEGRVKGYFSGCGHIPMFYEELAAAGVELDATLFDEHPDSRPPGKRTTESGG